MTTEAYPLGYVAGRHATENEVGGRFQHPPILEDFWFRVRCLRRNLRLRIPLIKHQHIPDRHDPDNFTFLGHSKMPHA